MNDLLICAKAVGIDAYIVPAVADGREWVAYNEELYTKPNRTGIYKREYNPRTNDAQCWELETFAQQNGWVFSFSHTLDEYCARHPKAILFTSKKRNEVVVKAVVAMEDTHE